MASHQHALAARHTLDPVTEAIAERIAADHGRHAIPVRMMELAGTRTRDLRHAMAALSQLSYSPVEFEASSKSNTCDLTIAWLRDAKMKLVLVFGHSDPGLFAFPADGTACHTEGR